MIATRHLRNDSRTIQLEYDIRKLPPYKKHVRSSSCDVKIMRSNSSNWQNDSKRIPKGHARNHSQGVESEFRRKLTHSRNNSRDDQSLNIKCIINYLKNNPYRPSTSVAKRPKRRNHSYDQIYLQNNLVDNEVNKRYIKNHEAFKNGSNTDILTVKNINTKDAADNLLKKTTNDETPITIPTININNTNVNPKDPTPLTDIPSTSNSNNILRHRRTSSKDANKVILDSVGHRRNSSQHKIEVDSDPVMIESIQLLPHNQLRAPAIDDESLCESSIIQESEEK